MNYGSRKSVRNWSSSLFTESCFVLWIFSGTVTKTIRLPLVDNDPLSVCWGVLERQYSSFRNSVISSSSFGRGLGSVFRERRPPSHLRFEWTDPPSLSFGGLKVLFPSLGNDESLFIFPFWRRDLPWERLGQECTYFSSDSFSVLLYRLVSGWCICLVSNRRYPSPFLLLFRNGISKYKYLGAIPTPICPVVCHEGWSGTRIVDYYCRQLTTVHLFSFFSLRDDHRVHTSLMTFKSHLLATFFRTSWGPRLTSCLLYSIRSVYC